MIPDVRHLSRRENVPAYDEWALSLVSGWPIIMLVSTEGTEAMPKSPKIWNEKQAEKFRRGLERIRQEIAMWRSFGYTDEQNKVDLATEAEIVTALSDWDSRLA